MALVATGAVVTAAPVVVGLHGVAPRIAPRLAGRGRRDHVALTFDDGPDDESTPAVLAALHDLGVTATFFWLADEVRAHPEAAAAVIAAGHEVGVHGVRHRSHLERPPWRVLADVADATAVVRAETGVAPLWLRPPYGVVTPATLVAARRSHLRVVLWTAWGRDWRPAATSSSVAADVARHLEGGATVLLHDSDVTSAPGSWRATVGALPAIVGRARDLGLAVGPLRDHDVLGAAGSPI